MGEKKYSIRFTKEELEKYTQFAEERRRPLATIIRDAMDVICENPALLVPSSPKTDLDILISALEIAAHERVEANQQFNQEINSQFHRLNQKVDFLLKKAKVSQKDIKKLEGDDTSGESIFG